MNYFHFDCACYKNFDGIKGNIIQLEEASQKKYDTLIFCCGPIIKQHVNLNKLFDTFKDCFKIGIGVSLFPENHLNFYRDESHAWLDTRFFE